MDIAKTYDKYVICDVKRKGKKMFVRFYEIKTGDMVWLPKERMYVTATDDAHYSGDATYDGWLFYANHDSFFPEDFVLPVKRKKTFAVPLVWEMRGKVYVEADSEEEAIDIALGPDVGLPDGSCIPDSCVVDDEIGIEVFE